MRRIEAIEEVFGLPDVWTVRPSTLGEMNPIYEQQMANNDAICGHEWEGYICDNYPTHCCEHEAHEIGSGELIVSWANFNRPGPSWPIPYTMS